MVTCWLILCFKQGIALWTDSDGGITRAVGSLSLKAADQARPVEEAKTDTLKQKDNAEKMGGSNRRGRGGKRGRTKHNPQQRRFGGDLTNSNYGRKGNNYRQTSHISINEDKYLPLTEKNLNRGLRGLLKHSFDRRGDSAAS